ncbi:MAG: hypothetical protein D4R92_02210 [Actinobacteria bacterium]|nr:MAG: hypothetical protein D4R92_02210 [Actinomycetota bacterium]
MGQRVSPCGDCAAQNARSMFAASECDVAIEITFLSMPPFYLAVRIPNERFGLGVTHGAVLEFSI